MKVTKTIIHVGKMDCLSEEMMIRGQLNGISSIHSLEFDIPKRILTIYHTDGSALILDKISILSLGAELVSNENVEIALNETVVEQVQRKTLVILLAVNAVMFIVEIMIGMLSDSMGLVGDGLDMLADASVYSLALYAVGKHALVKNRITLYSGFVQLALALALCVEVGRKFIIGSEPLSFAMISVSLIALIANTYCLYLITPHRHGEKHMTASWIFSANDVLANVGVIMAGILVYLMKSNMPDLLIGSVISIVLITGAIRILRLARTAG